MSTHDEIPGNISRKKFCKALIRLGFEIDKKGGKGDHYKITWPKNGKSVTIHKRVDKRVIKYITKQLEEISGITWGDIREEL